MARIHRLGVIATVCLSVFAIGCMGRTMQPEERERNVHVEHQLTRQQAYDKSEIWSVETRSIDKAVINVRQPDNGLILGKGIFNLWGDEVSITQPYTPVRVTFKFTHKDKGTDILLTFEEAHERWAARFSEKAQDIAQSLAKTLDGKVVDPPVKAPPQ